MRLATRQEIDRYLESRCLNFGGEPKAKAYIVESGAYSMLVCVCDLEPAKCEVHIVCPKDFVIKSRELAQLGIQSLKEMGYLELYTAIKPDENVVAHNFCKRIGFEDVGCYNGYIAYKRVL